MVFLVLAILAVSVLAPAVVMTAPITGMLACPLSPGRSLCLLGGPVVMLRLP